MSFVRKQLALYSTKKSMSLDWNKKANYASTSCPKLKGIFLSRFVYLKGPSVDHFMKWSRGAVWHREQGFVKKNLPIFPRQKIFQYFKYVGWVFFLKNIGLWQVSIFIGRDLSKTLPQQFYKNTNTIQNPSLHYMQSLDTHSFNSGSVCSCLKGVFINFIV